MLIEQIPDREPKQVLQVQRRLLSLPQLVQGFVIRFIQ